MTDPVAHMLEIVEFQNDNPEPVQNRFAGIEQHRPFRALDIHLQNKIALGRCAVLHPTVEGDGNASSTTPTNFFWKCTSAPPTGAASTEASVR